MAVGQLTVPRVSVNWPSMYQRSIEPSKGATAAEGSVVSTTRGMRSPHSGSGHSGGPGFGMLLGVAVTADESEFYLHGGLLGFGGASGGVLRQ